MVSYLTRINYGAVIAEMVTATGLGKSALSLAVTGSFVTYGIGQIVSGIFGDRFSPKKLVLYGLFVSVFMNFLIPICQNNYQMMAVWMVNGFAQAFMWPPMVRILTEIFDTGTYNRACVRISWGSSAGTILIYIISPVIISLTSWKGVFVFSGICGIFMAILWNRFCPEAGNKKTDASKERPTKSFMSPVIVFIMLAIVLQGMLRDGVTTWTPSFIAESFGIINSVSILSGVALPVFSIFCFHAAAKLYSNKIQNPLTCSGIFFMIGTVAAGILMLGIRSAAVSVTMLALLTGCMHGVNFILISMIPHFYRKSGNVATVSGILNSCTYVGSAVSTYGIAVLTEKAGWNATLFTWGIIALAGTVICFLCINAWRKTAVNLNR